MKHECITFHNVDNLECEGEYIKFDIHNYKLETPTPFQIIMGATNLYSTDYVYMFGKNPEITDRGVYCPYTIKYDGKDTFISIGFHDFISCGKAYAICSTLNPYSNQNIIGSLVEHNDTLNKIFPYDGQKQFSIWFNDNEGKRYRNLSIEGYIDLELIIDNTNNISLDV